MTWQLTGWHAQHPGLVLLPPRSGKLTFHFNPGTPLWVLVKAAVWVTLALGSPPTARLSTRWCTLTATVKDPRRWCIAVAVHGRNGAGLVKPADLYRPRGYDFVGWRWYARVTHPAHSGWLVRPRYV